MKASLGPGKHNIDYKATRLKLEEDVLRKICPAQHSAITTALAFIGEDKGSL